jgi:hypothetical protein
MRYSFEKSFTQQKEEKHMPTYSQGTTTPDISSFSKDKMDPGKRGRLFRFQPDNTYLSDTIG